MSVEFRYGESSFVFAGADYRLLEKLTESYAENDPKIIRLLDNGSFDSYSPSFIAKINPQLIITSLSSKKKKIQSDTFETALNKIGVETVNLGRTGAVILNSDGKTIRKIDWN